MGGLLAAGQPDHATCAWAVLGGPVSYTLGPEAGWRVAGWAGPEASRRHVRHASRRAEGLVSGWHTLRPVLGCASEQEVDLASCLGSRTEGLGHVRRLVAGIA